MPTLGELLLVVRASLYLELRARECVHMLSLGIVQHGRLCTNSDRIYVASFPGIVLTADLGHSIGLAEHGHATVVYRLASRFYQLPRVSKMAVLHLCLVDRIGSLLHVFAHGV